MARPIVQDSSSLGGRYCLEGTDIPIALIKADILAGDDVKELYRFINLTDEECESILAFSFPPARDINLRQVHVVLIVECTCGEDQELYGTVTPETVVTCICGRSWNVALSITPTPEITASDFWEREPGKHVNSFHAQQRMERQPWQPRA
jgi:hypothetical protein